MVEKTKYIDHAKLSEDPEILSLLNKSRSGTMNIILKILEKFVFSGNVIKYNRFGMK